MSDEVVVPSSFKIANSNLPELTLQKGYTQEVDEKITYILYVYLYLLPPHPTPPITSSISIT